MWRARHASSEVFNQAKRFVVVGCGILMVLFIGGFLYLADQFFMGYRTDLAHDISSGAFYLAGSVALVLIVVNQPD
jgi:predicted small integral membrane protein